MFEPDYSGYRLYGIPDGPEGVRETLRAMERMTRQFRSHPVIRELALQLVAPARGEDYAAEIAHLFHFARDEIRYVQDVRDVETLQSPIETLRLGQGDCDDKALLLGSLLESVGHPTRYVALAFAAPDRFEHVIVETRYAQGWIPLDPTQPQEPGWYPDNVIGRMVRHV